MSLKSLINQLFLYESLFSYILAVCVLIFRPKFKKQDFEVISVYLEKRITVLQWCSEQRKHVLFK